MREFSPATAAYLAARRAFRGHVLVWISARNRTTGGVEQIGFWTGADHQEFLIDGQARLYYAAGSMLKMDPIRLQNGIKVRSHRVTFSQIAPELEMLIRGYDPRHAPVEIHRALFDPLSDNLIDEPHLLIRGFVDKASLTTPPKGGAGSVTVEIASEARALTRALSRYRSDSTLKARAATDRFRQYASQTEAAETPWGR